MLLYLYILVIKTIFMDKVDFSILNELQKNGRITTQELSDRVNLSPTPCARRVKILEQSGVIKGYSATLDTELFGLPIMAFVSVRLVKQTDSEIKVFENEIMALEEITACYLMSGRNDYLLQVFAASLKHYENFVRRKLTHITGIGALETHFAFGQVKQASVLPSHGPSWGSQ